MKESISLPMIKRAFYKYCRGNEIKMIDVRWKIFVNHLYEEMRLASIRKS